MTTNIYKRNLTSATDRYFQGFCSVKCNCICMQILCFFCKYREYSVLPSLAAEEVWQVLQKKHHPLKCIIIGIYILLNNLHMLNCKLNSTNGGTFSNSAEKIIFFVFLFQRALVMSKQAREYKISKKSHPEVSKFDMY